MRALIVLMLVTGVASAHQSSTKYVELAIDGARAEVTLRCAPGDVTEPMKLAPDAKPTASAAAAVPLVPAYVASWLAVRIPAESGAVTCAASAQTARAEDDGFVAVHWIVTCPRSITTAILDFTAFFALDKRMEALVRIGDADEALRVTAADSPLVLDVGPDHVLVFLPEELAIALLVLALVSGARTFSRAARDAAIVLALYLAAHVAGSSLVAVPPVLARIILPATLIYAALEIAARPELRWRAATLVAFGLAQGIARAPVHSTLTELASGFVVGACAIAALPLVRIAAARFTQRRVIAAVAGAVCVVASVWLLQLALR